MSNFELDFYEAGIKDANEARSITVAAHSARYAALSRKHNIQIGNASIQAVTAYNKGVAYEINRQTALEF